MTLFRSGLKAQVKCLHDSKAKHQKKRIDWNLHSRLQNHFAKQDDSDFVLLNLYVKLKSSLAYSAGAETKEDFTATIPLQDIACETLAEGCYILQIKLEELFHSLDRPSNTFHSCSANQSEQPQLLQEWAEIQRFHCIAEVKKHEM